LIQKRNYLNALEKLPPAVPLKLLAVAGSQRISIHGSGEPSSVSRALIFGAGFSFTVWVGSVRFLVRLPGKGVQSFDELAKPVTFPGHLRSLDFARA
jgi:hypothetical protein